MQDHELDAWLGDTETTDEQYAAIKGAAKTIAERYPTPADGEPADVAEERSEALSAAAALILGDTTAESEAAGYARAQAAVIRAHARMTGAIVAEVESGTSERSLAARLGLSRVTIRKALARKNP